MNFLTLLMLLTWSLRYSCIEFSCIHDKLEADLSDITLIDTPKTAKSHVLSRYAQYALPDSGFQPIRIFADYSGVDAADPLVKDFVTNKLVPEALNFFNSFLKVRPVKDPIKIKSKKCYNATVPASHGIKGIDGADLVMYITTSSYEGENVLAWATGCAISPYYHNRPLVGQLNIIPSQISMRSEDWPNQLATVIHEITHILVFSDVYFRYYVDSDGSTLGKEKVVKNVTLRGMETSIIILPQVKERARSHFNCSTMEGLELENQGSSMSKGSHWERRVLFNEIMTPSSMEESIISDMTLALFEGSGWYKVDYKYAQTFTFGKNKGCAFITEPCMKDQKAQFDEFCDTIGEIGCTYSGYSKAACAIDKNPASDLPAVFNYFNSKNKQGMDPFSDNCIYMTRFVNGDCRVKANQKPNYLVDETFGPSSRCFQGNYMKTAYSRALPDLRGLCHEFQCQKGPTSSWELKVMIGNTSIICKREGEAIRINGYIGQLICPEIDAYCNYLPAESDCSSNCNGRGSCVDGKCVCFVGFQGPDCIQAYCHNDCSHHGLCDQSTGECICDEGWKGNDCSTASPEKSKTFMKSATNFHFRLSLVIFLIASCLCFY